MDAEIMIKSKFKEMNFENMRLQSLKFSLELKDLFVC